MQVRIDHLLAELALSQSQKYGKKSEKAFAVPLTKLGSINQVSHLSIIKKISKHWQKILSEKTLNTV
jgi:hypothetical protein